MWKYIITFLVLAAFFGGAYFWSKAPKPAMEEKIIKQQEEVMEKKEENNLSTASRVTLKTNHGDIELELFVEDSPKTVANFVNLAQSGFYNGTKFHRVIPDFMIQGGDPFSKDDDWSNDGFGGPGYVFEDEINRHKLVRGVLAMANSGPNTNGSQFFIVTAEATPWLDGLHTAFGRVVNGMEVVDKIEQLPRNQNDHPTVDATIIEALAE